METKTLTQNQAQLEKIEAALAAEKESLNRYREKFADNPVRAMLNDAERVFCLDARINLLELIRKMLASPEPLTMGQIHADLLDVFLNISIPLNSTNPLHNVRAGQQAYALQSILREWTRLLV